MKEDRESESDVVRKFLADLASGVLPTKIILCAVSGRACSKLGPIVKQYEGSILYGDDVDIAGLAESIVQMAKRDCKALGFAQKYGVLAFNGGDESIGRVILPMKPRA